MATPKTITLKIREKDSSSVVYIELTEDQLELVTEEMAALLKRLKAGERMLDFLLFSRAQVEKIETGKLIH
jgi:hypothetical protein